MVLEKSDLKKVIEAKLKAKNLSKSRFLQHFVILYAAYDSVCLDLQSVWESSWSKVLKAKKAAKIVKIENLNIQFLAQKRKSDFSSLQWNTLICNLNLEYDYLKRGLTLQTFAVKLQWKYSGMTAMWFWLQWSTVSSVPLYSLKFNTCNYGSFLIAIPFTV